MPDKGPGRGMRCDDPLNWRSVNMKDAGRHTRRTIIGADERGECREIVDWNLWLRKTGDTPTKTTQTQFRPPRNPHGVTETRTRDPSGGMREVNRLHHGPTSFYFSFTIIYRLYNCIKIIIAQMCLTILISFININYYKYALTAESLGTNWRHVELNSPN